MCIKWEYYDVCYISYNKKMIPCKCIQCDIDIKDATEAFCEKCLKRGPKDKLKKLIRKGVVNERR
jgi:hypothetical protein